MPLASCGQSSLTATCLIQCFPPWLRLAQCLRQFWDSRDAVHLLNAGKYATVFLMVLFAGLYNRARVIIVLHVLVCVSWDLRMDWTLLQGHGLLRRELLYTHEALYYGAMLLDVLLRVCWAVNILLAQMRDSAAAAAVSSVLTPLEVLRRCVWNMFRLESEQLRNCELMRAVRDVHFPQSCACLPEHVLREWTQNQNQETGPGHQNQHQENQENQEETGPGCQSQPQSCTHLLLTCWGRVTGAAVSAEERSREDSEPTWIEKKMLDTPRVENDRQNRDMKCAML
ncbi:xenotropic and polytropic retrovirus receptor 1 homolog [Sardina pilchardus]|uniref:xenotropic and polytropic retrovirus receptor 1 homolog n=1 Tax=Sardina pilchardus TaxID=27697 RepID=UPI002E124107